MLGGATDRPGAHDRALPAVQHGALAGRNAVTWLLELGAEALWPRLDSCSDGLGAVAELDVGALHGHVQPPGDVDRPPPERRARADHDGVCARVGAQRVERPPGDDAEAPALARREAPVAAVATELVAILVDDRAVLRLEPAPLEECAVVVAGEEAGLLAFAAAGNGEAGTLRLGARLGLRLSAERKGDAAEPGRVEPREHVRLVLLQVGGAREQREPVALDDARVVPGRQDVRTGAEREREQTAEAEGAVAAQARVRRFAAGIATDERINDGAPEVLAQVERHVRHAERVTGLARSDHGLRR